MGKKKGPIMSHENTLYHPLRLSCLPADFKVNQTYKKAGYASIMLDDYLVMTSLGVDRHNYRTFFSLWAINLLV